MYRPRCTRLGGSIAKWVELFWHLAHGGGYLEVRVRVHQGEERGLGVRPQREVPNSNPEESSPL